MNLDFAALSALRKNHPAWRLLMADHAPLIASFLHRVFIAPNVRTMAQGELVSKLEDELFQLRASHGAEAFPRDAVKYLDEWAQNDKGWLRKFYPPNSDEAHFDLTPATEKAIAWIETLTARAFVGTESRLMTVFVLLRQMVEGAETNAEVRLAELQKHKTEIELEIERVRAGDLNLLDETGLRDRFQQIAGTARELLADFREVEHNFHLLDQRVREQIAVWEGKKGELLENVFGERDVIADSDQGKSFRAFWDFLMSPSRQEELSGLLERVFEFAAIRAMTPDTRLKRIHYDWLEAGEQTQRTVARLSQQLRRYLDDQVWLENRRIMQVLRTIESKAIAAREAVPAGPFMEIDEPAPAFNLPMERPLFSPALKPVIASQVLEGGGESVLTDALFNQVMIDKAELAGRIRKALQNRRQITLAELLAEHPLALGLSELIAYLSLAGEDRKAVFDESRIEVVGWNDENGNPRQARLPRIIFNR